eukprot:TRINITY_DN9330_c0_g1_i2.p1 TRINITY_DN9330_c0_g1~~TRINITY_DN9330_c0_g1_i2.p1  ORF type:complete len:527 (-),score=95.35 TRINITY_DN9330_c0_g1_i2:134-1549(-)
MAFCCLMLLASAKEETPHFKDEGTYNCTFDKSDDMMNCSGFEFKLEEMDEVFGTEWWLHAGLCVGLVLAAGLMSGLTMGLMSLDKLTLRILAESGTPDQKKYAKKIIPLISNHHLLLVTLLLCNAGAMEALPVFLEKLMPPFVAIIVSVTAVLSFGEIIPQAICTRYGLAIGYYASWFVWGLIVVVFVIAYPIAKLLDCLLGSDHGTFYRRAELKELIQQHKNTGINHSGGSSGDVVVGDFSDEKHSEHAHGDLTNDEVSVIRGALSMTEKTLSEGVYQPMKNVYCIPMSATLDQELLNTIARVGHSRLPVYRHHRGHIVGLILTKNLIGIEIGSRIRDMDLVQMPRVNAQTPLFDLLNLFKIGKSHMALVCDPVDNVTVLGVVTLEDVIEQLLETEIYDESDLVGHAMPSDIPTGRKSATSSVGEASSFDRLKGAFSLSLKEKEHMERLHKERKGEDQTEGPTSERTPLL